MKQFKYFALAMLVGTVAAISFSSCKKGADDPVVSLVSREDRFANTWTLTKYEKNGVAQDLNGAKYMYSIYKSGTLTQLIEGTIFGFPTRKIENGTWRFLNDSEDVEITIKDVRTIYTIQRLASKELWLKKIEGTDTHIYYFE